jgi:hypothetical protein
MTNVILRYDDCHSRTRTRKEEPMIKTLVAVAVTTVLAATLSPAAAAERAITCRMTGSVEVKPGLRAPGPDYYGDAYKIKIEGELTGCEGSQGAPTAGSFKATGSGEGTCVKREIDGVSIVKWDNGNTTKFEFSTQDVASANAFTVTPTKSNEPAMQEGDSGIAALRFTADTAKCNTPEGVTSATFEGQLTSGSPD